MLLIKHLLALVCLNLKYLQLFGAYPYNTDYKTKKLIFVKNVSVQKEKRKHFVLLFIFVVMVCQLLTYRQRFSSVILYEGILYSSIFLFVITLVQVYFESNEKVTELFNLIITFEQRLIQGKLCCG